MPPNLKSKPHSKGKTKTSSQSKWRGGRRSHDTRLARRSQRQNNKRGQPQQHEHITSNAEINNIKSDACTSEFEGQLNNDENTKRAPEEKSASRERSVSRESSKGPNWGEASEFPSNVIKVPVPQAAVTPLVPDSRFKDRKEEGPRARYTATYVEGK